MPTLTPQTTPETPERMSASIPDNEIAPPAKMIPSPDKAHEDLCVFGEDLLSDLPVGLIESIMVFLPIKDAIRTSILSTNWRFKWTTIPHLVFHYSNDLWNQNDKSSSSRFTTFVTQTLLRHKGPLHKFRIVGNIDSCAGTDQWLLLLLKKDIRELILDLQGEFIVPSSLYLFQNLTLLEIYRFVCSTPPPPNFKGFSCLRTLIIRRLCEPLSTIQSVVAQSPLLEILECNCGLFSDSNLIISAPNLKYLNLNIFCCSGENVYFYAPLLTKLSLSSYFERWTLHEKAACCYYTKYLGGYANLDTLIGDRGLTKYLTRGIEHYKHPLLFHRLKTVILDGVSFKSMDEILVVVRLIVDASATLCHLQLNSYDNQDKDRVLAHFWDSICPQNCTFRKLKFVKLENFRGGIQEMNLMEFLLANSPVLEVLEVLKVKSVNRRDKKRIQYSTFKLLSYPRASSGANILFES